MIINNELLRSQEHLILPFVNDSPVLREHETKAGRNANVDISPHFADGSDLAQFASCYKFKSKVGHKCSNRDFKSIVHGILYCHI